MYETETLRSSHCKSVLRNPVLTRTTPTWAVNLETAHPFGRKGNLVLIVPSVHWLRDSHDTPTFPNVSLRLPNSLEIQQSCSFEITF